MTVTAVVFFLKPGATAVEDTFGRLRVKVDARSDDWDRS